MHVLKIEHAQLRQMLCVCYNNKMTVYIIYVFCLGMVKLVRTL